MTVVKSLDRDQGRDQDALPAVLEDGEGNRWDIFGEAISGPRIGQRLNPTTSLIGIGSPGEHSIQTL